MLGEGNREGLAIEIGVSLPATRVIGVLEDLIAWCGRPDTLRVDNGPEFLSSLFPDWCRQRGITIHYIQRGSQNAFIERFNRTHRAEVLDAHIFGTLAQRARDHAPLGSIPSTPSDRTRASDACRRSPSYSPGPCHRAASAVPRPIE